MLLGLAASLLLAACAEADPADLAEGAATPGAGPQATSGPAVEPAAELQPLAGVTLEPEGEVRPPAGAEREFRTDFSRHSVDYSEIFSGGPPKDGIPAIDRPRFETVEQADAWLRPSEPIILFSHDEDARAYPLQILTWHEIVNDVVGGLPVLVSFCPLCNTAIAFDRTVNGQVLDFGTTGRLRFSNLIMYDRQTETWWQQASGEAIAGELSGTQLEFLPAPIVAWEDFKEAHPSGQVLSRETGHSRPYGQNPYVGYDDINSSPFLYRGPDTSGRLPPMARVLAVELGGDVIAFPYETLQTLRVVNAQIGGEEIVVLWEAGTASALDSVTLAGGRDVGAAAAYSRVVEGRALTFSFEGSAILDQETGSSWDVLGRAVQGELAGASLKPVVAVNHFWFSWAAFKPETQVYRP
ncbi:MAG TPA: DUF3179 domain-containing protein [Anaerolineales bacterium]